MYSKHHLPISLLVGAAGALALEGGPGDAIALVGYAGLLGVGIDLDHFVVARLNAGDWNALRACLRDPSMAVLDQSRIFDEREVPPIDRLLIMTSLTVYR